jgi:hypothetical protein
VFVLMGRALGSRDVRTWETMGIENVGSVMMDFLVSCGLFWVPELVPRL